MEDPNMSSARTPDTLAPAENDAGLSSAPLRAPSRHLIPHQAMQTCKKSKEELSLVKKKKLQEFYRRQNSLIDTFCLLDKLRNPALAEELEKSDAEARSVKAQIAIYVTLIANVVLFGVNTFAAIQAQSISVIAAALDSFLDILCTGIIFFTNYMIRKKNPYKYPIGKSRLEPLGIIVLSSCMFTLTLQLQIQAVETLLSGHSGIDFSLLPLILMCCSVGTKIFLFLYCRLIKDSPSVRSLAQDHRNDVIVNTTGIGFALLGTYVFWIIDPLGGMLIGFYIMANWFLTAKENVTALMGSSADPVLLQQLTYLVFNHDPRILQIDTVRAFHLGLGFLVEVDVVLPRDMRVQEAHDIAESLQFKLEQLDVVERAFVHIDYETSHRPEHNKPKRHKLVLDLEER